MAPERGDRSLPAGTEGLPRVFLQSLRTLFDILDDRRRGYVHLREIESRWRGTEARELPAGVMEGLRRAAPASGYLTFERFVLGLRAALPGAEPQGETTGSGGRRGGEKPPSPRCAEERRGKSSGQRDPGHGQPRGRGEPARRAGSAGAGRGRGSGGGRQRRYRRLGRAGSCGSPRCAGGADPFPPPGFHQRPALPAALPAALRKTPRKLRLVLRSALPGSGPSRRSSGAASGGPVPGEASPAPRVGAAPLIAAAGRIKGFAVTWPCLSPGAKPVGDLLRGWGAQPGSRWARGRGGPRELSSFPGARAAWSGLRAAGGAAGRLRAGWHPRLGQKKKI